MPRLGKARSSATGARPRSSADGSMICRTRPTPETSMRYGRELMLAFALMGAPAAHAADALAVDVINASEPTLCAEKDNVYLKLQSAETGRFTVEAAHPAYAGTIVKDQWAPD